MKIIVVADTHYSRDRLATARRGELADVFLLRAIERSNRMLRPDLVLVLGDLINAPEDPDAKSMLALLREILDRSKCPYLVLPGNHDGDIEQFYQVFDRPAEFIDVGGVRFVPFIDPEQPGYNAKRESRDLRRMDAARASFDGSLIAIQHVPVFPPGTTECPYNYTNVESVISRMKQNGFLLSISGHYHRGFDLMHEGDVHYVASPAVCESPFKFLEIQIEHQTVRTLVHSLQMPESLRLVDRHIHTSFAYCNENMDFEKVMELGDLFGLHRVGFCEHSGHLYFKRQGYGSGYYAKFGIDHARDSENRMGDYIAEASRVCSPDAIGSEVDCDFSGCPVIRPEDETRLGFLTGGMHRLPELAKEFPDLDRASDEFLFLLSKFLKSNVQVLAHPFRVFRRAGQPIPAKLFEPTMQLLAENNVAAEVNFHTNEPPLEFFKMCIESGVGLTFGSDAHNLYEVGEFHPHLELMKRLDCFTNLEDVLVHPAYD